MGGSAGGSGGGSPPKTQQIAGISPGQLVGAGRQAVTGMAGAATNANIADRSADASDFVRTIFLDGGASIVNPELRSSLSSIDSNYRRPIDQANNAVNRLRTTITGLENKLTNPKLNERQRASIQAQLDRAQQDFQAAQTRQANVQSDYQAARTSVTSGQPTLTDLMAERFPEARQAMERSQPFLERMGQLGPAGERLMNALGQGFQANQIGSRDVAASQAAQAGRISAGQVGGGQLGQSLMDRALAGVQRGGRLSEQETRDAIQSARAGMAARGMATGSAGLAAELLNRDRFARQRELQDLEVARLVQDQDLERQRFNQDRALTADEANQRSEMLTNQFNAGELNRVGISNAELALRAASANEEARRLGNQANIGMLGDAFATQRDMNQEGLRAVGLGQALASDANPYNQAMRFYGSSGQNTGSQALPGAASMANNWMTGALGTQTYNAASQDYSAYMGRYGNYGGQSGGGGWSGAATGALSGAVAGSALGPYGALGGAVVGGAVGYFSDKNMKTDIKPIGKVTSVLDLPAYEYRYKGEKKKRRGVMAQDVQKVLPEAVTEVEYRGKKRLAIKPAIIGAALAEELINQTKAVAA